MIQNMRCNKKVPWIVFSVKREGSMVRCAQWSRVFMLRAVVLWTFRAALHELLWARVRAHRRFQHELQTRLKERYPFQKSEPSSGSSKKLKYFRTDGGNGRTRSPKSNTMDLVKRRQHRKSHLLISVPSCLLYAFECVCFSWCVEALGC